MLTGYGGGSGHSGGYGGRGDDRRDDRREYAPTGHGGRSMHDADSQAAKRVRPNPDAVLSPKAEPAPKVETAAEKLARLRAKQALKNGGVGFLGSIGGDYAGNVSAAPAKGLQRYQQMVREGRQ